MPCSPSDRLLRLFVREGRRAALLFAGAVLLASVVVPGHSAAAEEAGAIASGEGSGAAAHPRLVLVLVIDQLRRDRLDPTLPGGLGRIAREGRSFREAVVDHALSETCPGHATALRGRHPGPIGVPGNRTLDPVTGEAIYCVADEAKDAAMLGGGPGRSPRRIRSDGLGDWLAASGPGHRVYSVSGKDRAAIAMAGQRPGGAYWFAMDAPPRFTSSGYYMRALPGWVEAFDGPEGPLSKIPDAWTYDTRAGITPPRDDEQAGEADRHSATSPHPIRDEHGVVDVEAFRATPLLDELTLAFARELVVREGLTQPDGAPHLLMLGLSATDSVGHAYGPFSRESHDALRRLDAALAGFLAFLESEVGRDGLLVALTADHGVLPLPEWLDARGELDCPVAGGRIGATRLLLGLLWKLTREFGPWYWPARDWLQVAGSQLRVNRARVAERGAEVEDVIRVVEQTLEADPGVEEVWNRREIEERQTEIARLYRNSFDPESGTDLILELAPECLIGFQDTGTSHGTPHLYDRAVPLVFMGAGIEPGEVAGPAATVDLAPTLAEWLGLTVPGDLDGRVLPLRDPLQER